MEFFTIGVYNSTEQEYFTKLTENNIDTFCDIRQRRGVRGAKYAFVNSNRLQEKLNELDIKYGHVIDLAPTTDIRDLQKAYANLYRTYENLHKLCGNPKKTYKTYRNP